PAPGFRPPIYKARLGAGGALTALQRIPRPLRAGASDPARAAVGGPANEITGLPQISTAAQGTAAGLPAATAAASRDEVPFAADGDRKSTPLNSSHRPISCALFSLQKKKHTCNARRAPLP